ncbi:MAG: hypothetical protein IJJ74_11700 [Eubacterium sp.]|nr:hypothetical protein [Eubacterium sp.]
MSKSEKIKKIENIDVMDDAITINGTLLKFPLSYEEVKAVLGEARLNIDEKCGKHISYIYDELGIDFEGSPEYLSNLKKKKAFVDKDHIIIGMTLYVTGKKVYSFFDTQPKGCYKGDLTVLGERIDMENTWKEAGGYGYTPQGRNAEGKKEWLHMQTSIYTEDKKPLYDDKQILKDINITFKPERPKSKENYNIEMPEEECLVFDTFNFKLAVINELMYNQETLKPYFDIYDYMAFKKGHWNLETSNNVRAAVNYFKELPIPARLADLVTEINMDGDDDIYMNIAPEWDGEDERFDFNTLTEAELKQFKNLKKMLIFGNDKDAEKLRKVCDPLGIEVEPMGTIG